MVMEKWLLWALLFISFSMNLYFLFHKKKRNRETVEEVDESNDRQQMISDDSAEGYEHEVFLSFYGEDTRKNFTDHLHSYLKDLRIETFRDKEKLYVGEKIGPTLMEAIEKSKIMMPIFSKNYASSKWCLMELTHMVKWVEMHKDTTLMCPIFYNVTPSEVRNQTGSFQKAFAKHVKKFDKETVVEWKEALGKVPEVKGWERDKIGDGYEAELEKAIDTLKKQLTSDILKRPSDKVQMNQKTFKNTKALIVLDDVDDRSQLTKIIGKCDWFGHGSRIIVTTRKRDIFIEADGERIFEPGVMNSYNALSLFCKHAFRRDCPREGYEDLSKEMVSKVAGLPLSLEVIGSLLATKKIDVWHEQLKKIEKIMPEKIQESLQISYDMLEHGQQQIFLDIACHFIKIDRFSIEKERSLAASFMWEDCGFWPASGIDALVTLSLVKIDEHGRFKMHDQLRDLGREIVQKENRNPGERSRLWSPEEAWEVLASKKVTERVETLDLCDLAYSNLSNEVFQRLSDLRYLDLSYSKSKFTGDFRGIFSKLRWFRWRSVSQIAEITNFCLPRLVVLDLSCSAVSDGWEDLIQIKRSTNLKILDLSVCHNLTKTPDLSACSKLERLNLEWCSNLAEISPSIGHLQHLNYLNLNQCDECCEEVLDNTSSESKWKLPEFIWNLKSLVELQMMNLKVTELSEATGNLTNLSILNVRGTRIKKFPNTIGLLVKLEELDASNCDSLEELPQSVGNLQSLRRLNISDSRVKRLPSEIGSLEKLETLDARGCQSLEELPESIGNLRRLRGLLTAGSGIERLPSTIGLLEELEDDEETRSHYRNDRKGLTICVMDSLISRRSQKMEQKSSSC